MDKRGRKVRRMEGRFKKEQNKGENEGDKKM